MPLLEGTDGVQKMSKSLGNCIGITDPPVEMYGKVMSISDSLMIKYYELLSMGDAAHLEVIQQGRVHPMEAKKQLAAELVTRFYSEAAAAQAAADFAQRFQRRELPSEMETFAWSGQEPAVWICHLLRVAGLVKSTSEARRLIQQGGVRVNGAPVEDRPADRSAPRGQGHLRPFASFVRKGRVPLRLPQGFCSECFSAYARSSVPLRFCRSGRAAERRQVYLAQHLGWRQGGDRHPQTADDP